MKSRAPRCSEPWSCTLTLAFGYPPSSASAEGATAKATSMASSAAARMRAEARKVLSCMRGHPFRNRLGPLEIEERVDPDECEEREVQDHEDPSEQVFDRGDVGVRAEDPHDPARRQVGADASQQEEHDREDRERDLVGKAPIADRLHTTA